jgi:hypothetical protein
MITYPKMNREIVGFLRLDDAPITIYAAARIEELEDGTARLRDALAFIANHEAEPGSALETVAKFARLALGEDAP